MPNFKVFRHFPVHISVGPLVTEFVRYVDEKVYPNRFAFKMVAPTDKPIQRILEEDRNPRELQSTPLPSLVVTPVIDEPVGQWQKLWNSRRLAPRLGSKFAEGIIWTEDYRVSYVTRRIAGHFDITIATNSYMETHDIMMAFYDQFYGLNMWSILGEINLYFVIPEELVFYTEDGGRIVVDWENSNLNYQLIRSINKKRYLYPLKYHPYIRLNSLSDASNLYGGTDAMPTYGLTGTVEFEAEFPAYLTIETDYLIKEVKPQISMGTLYFSDQVYDYLSYDEFIRNNKIYYPKKRFVHEFDSTVIAGFEMDLPYVYNESDNDYIFFTSRGEMNIDIDYEFIDSGSKVKFKYGFKKGEVLEFIYCNIAHI